MASPQNTAQHRGSAREKVLLLLVAALWPAVPGTDRERAGGELWGRSDFCSTWNAKLGAGNDDVSDLWGHRRGAFFQSLKQQH